jgi:hypothetical protein
MACRHLGRGHARLITRLLPSGNVREIWLMGRLLVSLAPTKRPVAGYVGGFCPGHGRSQAMRGFFARGLQPALPKRPCRCYLPGMTTYPDHPARPPHRLSPDPRQREPGVVFLGGFRSDMTGSKAQPCNPGPKRRAAPSCASTIPVTAQSHGAFVDGAITDWREDAAP